MRYNRCKCWSTLFLHGVCMLRESIYGECAHEQYVGLRRTLILTLTHTITAYSVSGNVVRVCAYSSVQLDKSRVEKEFTVSVRCFSGRSRSERQGRVSVSDDHHRRDSRSSHHRDAEMYHVTRPHSARKVYVLREVPPPAAFKVILLKINFHPGIPVAVALCTPICTYVLFCCCILY